MKLTLFVTGILCSAAHVFAQDQVVIERGDARLTLSELDARMARFPHQERPVYARRADNMSRLMDQLLLNKQLAAEAKSLGLDKDAKVRADIELAMEEILALHRLNELANPDRLPDLEQIAREQYQVDPTAFQVPESREIRHVLIATDERSVEDAARIAQDIADQARTPGADFAALVDTHSDDEAKRNNQGRYIISREGEYAPAFEEAARSLTEPGQVSDPVKTDFGFHVIRLDAITPARTQDFDEVKATLIANARADHYKRVRADHISLLKREPESGNEQLLRSLPARYGGRPEEVGSAD